MTRALETATKHLQDLEAHHAHTPAGHTLLALEAELLALETTIGAKGVPIARELAADRAQRRAIESTHNRMAEALRASGDLELLARSNARWAVCFDLLLAGVLILYFSITTMALAALAMPVFGHMLRARHNIEDAVARLTWSLDALPTLDRDAPSRVVLNGWDTKSLGYVWGVTETRSRSTARNAALWSEYLRRAMRRTSEQYADAARSSLRLMRVFGD